MSSKPVSPQDYFDLMQKMANPSGFPFQSLMFPTLDAKEIDKKITDLRSVEHWLQANLGVLQLSIRTLEYQKALLSTSGSKTAASGPQDAAQNNPAMWAWQMMNQASEQFQTAAKQAATKQSSTPAPPKSKASARKR